MNIDIVVTILMLILLIQTMLSVDPGNSGAEQKRRAQQEAVFIDICGAPGVPQLSCLTTLAHRANMMFCY